MGPPLRCKSWLDADFDRFHPLKKNRPSVLGALKREWVYLEYASLTVAGLGLAMLVSAHFLAAAFLFWLMAVFYNVNPFRTKDRVYLDVLTESVNNPLRLALGWFVVISDPLPPSSLTLGYWMLGAYLMGVKRATRSCDCSVPRRLRCTVDPFATTPGSVC